MRLSQLLCSASWAAVCAFPFLMSAQDAPKAPATPATPGFLKPQKVAIDVYDRVRTDANDWYAAPPYTTTYPYVEQLLRIAVSQRIKKFDYRLELSENNVFDVPTTSVSPVTGQGQLGLGGSYYAGSGSQNTLPVAASFKQGWLRYHGKGPGTTARIGRFEFFEGAETTPKVPTLLWLQNNRIQQRLLGNFGFSNGQRSLDGIDAHYGRNKWDITGLAARSDQGVFNMNANPELNVDVQYLAYTRSNFKDRFVWRVFGLGYHDGRTGLTKTDNRSAAARAKDHQNIRLGTYGADFITSVPAGPGEADFLFWGVLQNGQWGTLNQHAGAFAVEGGYRLTKVRTKPWLRGGDFRSTGDNNNADATHNTFFAVLPTPRVYARFPFFNSMNSTDTFVQLVDNPIKKLEVRSDLHFLKLTSGTDFWYQGGGAFDNKVFGVTGRPGNGHNSFASLLDISSDYALTPTLALNLYYAHSYGRTVIQQIYPGGKQANFGYLELVYRLGIKQKIAASKLRAVRAAQPVRNRVM